MPNSGSTLGSTRSMLSLSYCKQWLICWVLPMWADVMPNGNCILGSTQLFGIVLHTIDNLGYCYCSLSYILMGSAFGLVINTHSLAQLPFSIIPLLSYHHHDLTSSSTTMKRVSKGSLASEMSSSANIKRRVSWRQISPEEKVVQKIKEVFARHKNTSRYASSLSDIERRHEVNEPFYWMTINSRA